MTDVGEYLRREREAREVSLKEISNATKISVEFLQAIENNEFEKLPAEVFVIGFIRNYARYLGLNEDDVIHMYKEFIQERDLNLEKNLSEVKRKKKIPLIVAIVVGIMIIGAIVYVGATSGQSDKQKSTSKNQKSLNAFSIASTTSTQKSSRKKILQVVLEGENSGRIPVYIQYCQDATCQASRSSWREAFLKNKQQLQIRGKKIIGIMSDHSDKVKIFKNGKALGLMGKGGVKVLFIRPDKK